MKNRIKKYAILALVPTLALFLFYKGRLSLQVEEKYAGYEYDILFTQGGSYVGVVNSDGLIKFPWNPSRKNGILTIELKKGGAIHRDGLGISPSHGRYFLYKPTDDWESGRILYIFGISIKETKIGPVKIQPGELWKLIQRGGPP